MVNDSDQPWCHYYRRFLKDTADPAEAEDLVQELRLKVLRFERRVGALRNPDGVVYLAYGQVLADWLRRKYSGHEQPTVDGELPEVVDPTPTPEERYSNDEEQATMLASLRELVRGRKQRILLDNWNRSADELAHLMRTTPEAVRTCRAKLRRRLRRLLAVSPRR